MKAILARGVHVCLLAALLPCLSSAQVVALFETGQITDAFGLRRKPTPVVGAAVSAVINGYAGEKAAFLMPVSVEFRTATNTKQNSSELAGNFDFAIRVRNLSFGPGLGFGYYMRPDLSDARCAPSAILPAGTSSCLLGANNARNGNRVMGDLVSLGYNGFAKVTFGPQNRAFIQVRYTRYDKTLTFLRFADRNGKSPEDFPEYRNGQDARLSAGYVFGKWIVRGQYIYRRFDFKSEKANNNGFFNQRTQIATLGVGYVF